MGQLIFQHVEGILLSCWPIPKNHSQVQNFLGFAGFYRHFVKDFSTIAAPLHEFYPLCKSTLENTTAPLNSSSISPKRGIG
jgi:hypothetical protein